jgi:hypothetical protein
MQLYWILYNHITIITTHPPNNQRSRTEAEGDHGHLQGALYAYRFGGAVAGAVAGALVYNERVPGWGFGLTFAQVLAVAGLLPLLLLLPLLVPLREMPVARRGPHTRQSIVPEEVEADAAAGDATATVSDASASGGAAEVVEIGGGLGNEEVGFVPVSTQIWQIWEIIQLPIVYMPMAFVYSYNLFQSTYVDGSIK